MPVLRLLAESSAALGSPGSRDVDGYPVFPVAPADTVALTVDATGWIGAGDTLASAAWDSDLTISGEATSGATSTALAAIPAASSVWPDYDAQSYAVTHTATATSGRVRVTRFYLVA